VPAALFRRISTSNHRETIANLEKWTDSKTTVAGTALVQALGEWTKGEGPRYLRLAGALRSAIERGQMPPGARLPAERVLTRLLAVSRTTVVGAYDALRQEGLLESRQGSGTRVARWRGSALESDETARDSLWRRRFVLRAMVGKTTADVEFLGAHLPGLPDFFKAAMDEAEGDLRSLVAEHGYFPLGLPALRRAIAAYFKESGLLTSEEEVLVTGGAQQAISLVANVFVDPGKVVLMEDPTYLGAIDAFASFGARPTGIAVGPTGIRVDLLRAAMARTVPRVVYVVATCHNPTGTVMPEEHRRDIARDIDGTNTLLVEDMTLADFCLDGDPPRPIAAFARGGNVLTVGSLSKLFWGGLRVGWIRGPQALIARLAEAKVVSDLGGSILSQAVAARVLDRAGEVVRLRRRQVRPRRDLLARLLGQHLPSWSWSKPAGGLSLWVRLPSANASELAPVALRHGVAIVPGTVHSPEGQHADCLRLPFVAEPEVLRDGVERLSRAWKELQSMPQRTPRGVGVLV